MYENKLNNCDFSRKYCKKNSKKLVCASLDGRLGQISGLFPRVFVFPASRLYSIIFARKSQKVTEMFRLLLLVCALLHVCTRRGRQRELCDSLISVFPVLSVWNKRRFAFFRSVRIVIMI